MSMLGRRHLAADHRTPPHRRGTGRPGPATSVVVVLLGVELLLVGLSIGAAVLDQPALALMAGTATITLAGEVVRRLLTTPGEAAPATDDLPTTPNRPTDPIG